MAKKRKDPVKAARDRILRSLIAKSLALVGTESDKNDRTLSFAELLRETADELEGLVEQAADTEYENFGN